jgi:hypothetical protein
MAEALLKTVPWHVQQFLIIPSSSELLDYAESERSLGAGLPSGHASLLCHGSILLLEPVAQSL